MMLRKLRKSICTRVILQMVFRQNFLGSEKMTLSMWLSMGILGTLHFIMGQVYQKNLLKSSSDLKHGKDKDCQID